MIRPYKKLPLTFSPSIHLGNPERKILGETSIYPKDFKKMTLERDPLRNLKARKIVGDTFYPKEFH